MKVLYYCLAHSWPQCSCFSFLAFSFLDPKKNKKYSRYTECFRQWLGGWCVRRVRRTLVFHIQNKAPNRKKNCLQFRRNAFKLMMHQGDYRSRYWKRVERPLITGWARLGPINFTTAWSSVNCSPMWKGRKLELFFLKKRGLLRLFGKNRLFVLAWLVLIFGSFSNKWFSFKVCTEQFKCAQKLLSVIPR